MFKLKVVTPTKAYGDFDLDRVTIPTSDGLITVLSNHMDIITPVNIGILTMIGSDFREEYAVSDGLFTFKDNEASLLVNTIENSKDIDFIRAEQAKMRASEQLKRDLSIEEIKTAELDLKRALVRLSLNK